MCTAATRNLQKHRRARHVPSINFLACNPNSVPVRTCWRNSSPVLTCLNCGKSDNILEEMVPFPPPGLPSMRSVCAAAAADDDDDGDDDEYARSSCFECSWRMDEDEFEGEVKVDNTTSTPAPTPPRQRCGDCRRMGVTICIIIFEARYLDICRPMKRSRIAPTLRLFLCASPRSRE